MSKQLDQAYRAHASGQPEEALRLLTSLFQALQDMPGLPPFPAGNRRADELLATLGREMWNAILPESNSEPLKGDLVLATQVYTAGGHTPVIKDLASALPEKPLALWLTNSNAKDNGQLSTQALQRTGLEERTKIFGGDNLWSSANLMIQTLAELCPARIFLVHHPDDCVAVVVTAAAAAMGSTVDLLHHADHRPTCGLYLEGAKVYDFTPRAFAFSRQVLGLHTAWLPLTCPDPQGPEHTFMTDGHFVTALSGSRRKVREMRSPYYPELVSAILEKTGGLHVHIGALDKITKNNVLGALRSKGIPGERVLWIKSAPTLVQALVEHNVDLMINTYPRGGARTAVETMAAGRAMIWHSPSADLDRLSAQMRYPEAPVWHSLDELLKILDQVDRPWLEQQGTAARSWYHTIHHPRVWEEALADFDLALERQPPAGFDLHSMMEGFLEQALDVAQNEEKGSKSKRTRRLPFWPFKKLR